MKKTIGTLMVAGIILTACSSQSDADLGRFKAVGMDDIGNGGEDVILIIDNETGCRYMHINAGYGQVIEPVLNKDGKPYCGKVSSKQKKPLYTSDEQ
ncbi:DUF6440 family protein [Priestia megaterium]|uniref:DUF6440 family protein n=1 Tax=Priestia megaterium TaxID=1404 RepID=UPI0028779669|nr:DUF6440 family protein [Priestia megaterium]